MQKPERSKNLGCGFVDGSMDGCCGEGRENVGATPEGRKWYLGFRVWCWLRLVEVVVFSVVCCFWYVFVCVSVVFQLFLMVTFPETNNTWHLKTHVWKTMIISFWGSFSLFSKVRPSLLEGL